MSIQSKSLSFEQKLRQILLNTNTNTNGNVENKKIRLTFGFYDPISLFFQQRIPDELFQKMYNSLKDKTKGIRTNIPITQEIIGYRQIYNISPSMWDIKIDYVLCEQQAVFFIQESGSFQIIVSETFIPKMIPLLSDILLSNLEMFPERITDGYYETIQFSLY